MNTPKRNFSIIPNWLVDEFQTVKEFKAFIKMYNGWGLMKDADGWYYRSKSKLKEDFGMNPTCSDTRVTQLTRRFEELGILQIKSEGKKANWYKFNEDFMFNHEEDTADEVVPQTGTSVGKVHDVPKQDNDRYKTYLSTKVQDVPKQDRYKTYLQYNTVSNNTVKNKIYKEKEINKEKESNTAGQGSLRNDGVSISSLTNKGNNFIQSEGERDSQGDISTPKRSYGDVYWKVRKMIEKGKGFSEQKVRDYVNRYFIQTGKVTQHEFEGDLAELQRLRDSMLDRESQDINTSSDLHVNKQTLTSSERSCQCTNEPYTPNNVKELQTMVDKVNLHPTEKRSKKLEVSAADLDNCVLSDNNLPNKQEYQNIEKCRQEAPYAILSNSGHSFTSEPMVMYGT